MIRKVSFRCVGISKLLFSRKTWETKGLEEGDDQFEERIWRLKAGVDTNGNVSRPGIEFCRTLETAGKWLSMKLSGNKTFTDRFRKGVSSGGAEWFPVLTDKGPIKASETTRYPLWVPVRGNRGPGPRVVRIFPIIPLPWSIDVNLLILDDAIIEKVFEDHIKAAGAFDGLGSMRVGNGNPNGQFLVEDLKFDSLK